MKKVWLIKALREEAVSCASTNGRSFRGTRPVGDVAPLHP